MIATMIISTPCTSKRKSCDENDFPLCRLPEDVLCKVMSFLDAKSLCEMRKINRKFRESASKNSAGWVDLCRNLWKNKIHVCVEAQEELRRSSSSCGCSHGGNNITNASAMSAYRKSLLDGNNRDHLTREELIFNPATGKGTVWSFRFKEAAGSDWTAFDPWYNHQPCRKMVFLDDGRVKIYAPRTNKREDKEQNMIEEGHADISGGYADDILEVGQSENMEIEDASTTRSPSRIDPRRSPLGPEDGVNDTDLQDPAVPMTWRFVTQPLDFPDRPIGSYIRFSVRGREVPTYVCRRSPTNNWGFVMESCWGVYASFKLPPRPRNDTNGRVLRRRRRRQRRLRRSLNLVPGREVHFHVEIEDDSSDDEEGSEEEPTGDDALVWDDNFNVTTELQWREAFLYNNFSFPLLPEGSDALAEFRRNYGI